MRNVIN